MAKLNQARLDERSAARKSAREIMAVIEAETAGKSKDWMTAFRDEFQPPAPEPKAGEAEMTDTEARRFETLPIEFGKYAGQKVADIPLPYLDYIVGDSNRHFIKELGRYLKNESVADRLRQELDDYDGESK